MDLFMSETAANPSPGPAMTTDAIVEKLMAEESAASTATETTTEAQAPEPSNVTDPTEAAETPAEPLHTVKVRGEERQVKLQELLDGYSRNEDYRAKTAEVAEQRRAVDADKAAIAARATQLDSLLQRAPFDPVLAEGQRTDWQTLARDNPAEYVARKEQFEGRVQYWQQVQQHAEATKTQAAQAASAEGERRMREAVPEWADDGKRKELASGIANTLKEYGFAPEEFGSVTDHRVLLVARDAMLYRQMQAERKAADAKRAAPSPPRTMTPGTPQGNTGTNVQARALLAKAAKSGRVDDQVNAILANLG